MASTESTSMAPTESTSMMSTESTSMASTESTSMMSTESPSMASTESTSMMSTESTSMVSTESTSMMSTESTSMASTESPSMASTESTSMMSTESTSMASTESPSMGSTESTSMASTESTSMASTESTSMMSTESTSMASTESTSMMSTESTSMASTESTSMASTESPSMASTESTSMMSTESTSMASTESTSMMSTESTSMASTESPSMASTESTSMMSTESTSMASTESTSMMSTESTSMASTESTSMMSTESTSMASTESTSMASTESPSMASTESTSMMSTESTSMASTESTSMMSTESTSMASTEPTSMMSTESTSMASTESSTTPGDVDECTTGMDNCDSNANCTNTVGSFVCVCKSGFTGSGINCTDLNECNLRTANCHGNATCSNTPGSYNCSCDSGFTGSGYTCTDINECSYNLDNCHFHSMCFNEIGSFTCNCNPGFTGNGTNCQDIDECASMTHNCDSNAACQNVNGSFTCRCLNRFYGNGTTCEACPSLTAMVTTRGRDLINLQISYSDPLQTSYSISYSSNGGGMGMFTTSSRAVAVSNLLPQQQYSITVRSTDVCAAEWTRLVSTVGQCTTACTNANCVLHENQQESCDCFENYRAVTATACEIIPICERTVCGNNSYCVNPNGCSCDPGYVEDTPGVCRIRNLCDPSPCRNGSCSSDDGLTFLCTCAQNFIGPTCDFYISPCKSNPCRNGGQCIDQEPGFRCLCPSEYNGTFCQTDVNECESASACHVNANCSNFIGGFNCTCNAGFRSDGMNGCLEIILFPYGFDDGDELLPISDDVISDFIQLEFLIPFGSQSYDTIRVSPNGILLLGTTTTGQKPLYRPIDNFNQTTTAIIAPFWDDFEPAVENNGRVYYQSYETLGEFSLSQKAQDLVNSVKSRIDEIYGGDFNPTFVFKTTWNEMIPFPQSFPGYRNHPSTFQAVLATDGCATYLIYLYKKQAMLWDTTRRVSNIAFIGFTNGAEFKLTESQGDYRPDLRATNKGQGTKQGQYFYKLTQSALTPAQQSRCSCLNWYVKDVKLPKISTDDTCPCSPAQAFSDRRYVLAIDFWFYIINRFYNNRGLNSRSTTEWELDYAPFYLCFQRRFNFGSGPRCCYLDSGRRVRTQFVQLRFGAKWDGPFGSRYERYQIPFWFFWFRNRAVFDQQYNDALEFDLVPRRQCCEESNNAPGYCRLYEERRPIATCDRYIPPRRTWFFGDPHLTTIDGASYTFNGNGEYYMVYAPGVFTMQARTTKVSNADGNETDATAFVSFVAQDHNQTSGVAQFDVDYSSNGSAVIVKVNGVVVGNLSDLETDVDNVSLSVDAGSYTAIFPSGSSLTVNSANYILSMSFTGDTASLEGKLKGLLGTWNGDKEDDFEFRNGVVLNYTDLQVTTDLDILNGTLSERKLYPFGQSWQIMQNESLFNYTGNDTYATHNPNNTTEPPFLEDLVANQRNSSSFNQTLTNCTVNNVLSLPCLYDTLTTNRTDIGQSTLSVESESSTVNAATTNVAPNFTQPMGDNIVNGILRAQVGVETVLMLNAVDPDMDTITYSLANSSGIIQPPGVTINEMTGELCWTPTEANGLISANLSLSVQAEDTSGGFSVLTIRVKLCVCKNNGTCYYNLTISGNENYEVVGCNCTEAYTGNDCAADRNDCSLSACFTGVQCNDTAAPGTGFTCGDCPDGTQGDGRNCSLVDYCASSPCMQICTSVVNGSICSCNSGYRVRNSSLCVDIDECMEGSPCADTSNSMCVNGLGNFSCNCVNGYEKNGTVCNNIDECTTGAHNCSADSSTCVDTDGAFICTCNNGYSRPANTSLLSECVDTNECVLETDNCLNTSQTCVNIIGSFRCDCAPGYEDNGTCVDVNECNNSSLNNCDLSSNRSLCTNIDGSFTCSCLTGYTGNGTVCTDVDECTSSPCATNANCTNFDGGYLCACVNGYSEANGTCVNIDECSIGSNNCATNATCADTDGSFNCTCNDGFEGSGTTCTDIDECMIRPMPCDSMASCMNEVGNYTCVCPMGFEGDGKISCTDTNECNSTTNPHNCHVNATCSNSVGSFNCACRQGYTGDGVMDCSDVNECNISTHNCHGNAICSNTIGSFNCSCDDGFSGNGTYCANINECDRNTDNCHSNATCIDTDGSFTCTCDPGFTGSGTNCTDINECSSNPCTTVGSYCRNIQGSFACACNSSYYGNGTDCTVKPILDNLAIRFTNERCVSAFVDRTISFGLYQVKLETPTRTVVRNTSTSEITICNLNPSTSYNLSAAVLSPKDTTVVIDNPIFSSPITATTDALVLAFSVGLVTGTPFTADLLDITSNAAMALINRFKPALIDQMNSGMLPFVVTDVTFIAFRNGSTIASVEAPINSTNSSDSSTNVTVALSGSSNFTNGVTVIPPSGPTNVTVINIATTSIDISYGAAANATLYEIKATCNGTTYNRTTTQTTYVVTGLPSNSVCSVEVRALVELSSTSVARSAPTDPLTFTTLHTVSGLTASAAGNSATVSFNNVDRIVSASITTTPASSTITLTTADFASAGSTISRTINGLSTSTNYTINIETVTQDHAGLLRTASESTSVVTLDTTMVSNVSVFDIQLTSFRVQFMGVSGATSYTVRTFLGDMLVDTTMSDTTNIRIEGVQPSTNAYYVSVAFGTPSLSDFSPNTTTMIWNFTETLETSLSLSWLPFPTTMTVNFYDYNVTDDLNMVIVDNNVGPAMVVIPDLMPGVLYTVGVSATMAPGSPSPLITLSYFQVTQITRSSAPILRQTAQNMENLTISWPSVKGAESYETSLRLGGSVVTTVGGVGSTTVNATTLTNLTNGAVYEFTACSTNAAGSSCASINVSGFLAVPGVTRIDIVTQTSIRVSFDLISGASSYNITATFVNGTTADIISTSDNNATFTGLASGTVYNFTLTAIYPAGFANGSAISQITIPADPRDLVLQRGNSTFASVSWSVGVGVTTSVVSLQFSNGTAVVSLDENATTFESGALSPGTNYTLFVRNRNLAGDSGNLSITFQTAPSPPTDLNYTDVTQTSISISFTGSAGASTYSVTITPGTTTNITTTAYVFTSLTSGTEYTITVQALSPPNVNPLGILRSTATAPLVVITVPPDVTNIQVSSRTASSLTVTFDSSLGATNYRAMAASTSDNANVTTNLTTVEFNGLSDGTAYTISVIAINAFGESGISMKTGEFTRSLSPSNLTFSAFTTTSFVVQWDAQRPSTVNYSPEVVLASDGSRPSGVMAPRFTRDLSISVTGLSPGTEYNVSIQTIDFVGPTDPVAAVTELTLPAPTSRITITRHATDALDFEWAEVQGAASYRVTVNDTSTSSLTTDVNVVGMNSSSLPLQSGRQYEITVIPVNRNGIGMATTIADYTITDPFPSVVSLVSNTNMTITVSFTAVNGVEMYTAAANSGASTDSTCTSTTTPCTLSGLQPGTDYNVSVKGDYSSGSESQFGVSTLLTTIPAIPTNLQVVSGDFSLNATADSVNGATSYTFAVAGGSSMVSTEPTAAFTGLDSGQRYTVTATATKTASSGVFTSEQTQFSTSTTRAVPSGVTVNNVRPDQFDVSWDSIAGSRNFTVTATSQNTSVITSRTVATGTMLTVPGLMPGELYNVTVRSGYSTGSGLESDTIVQITAPGTPMGVAVVTPLGTNHVALTWGAVTTATHYRIEYAEASMMVYENITSSEANANVTGLMPGVTYKFTVLAINQALESFSSAEVRQITVPASPMFVTNSTTQTTITAVWDSPTGTDVFLVDVTANDSVVIINETINAMDTSVSYTYANGIRPGQNYTLCVVSRTADSASNGIGPQTSQKNCLMLVTAPSNATSPMEISTTTESIEVSWSPAVGATYYMVSATLESNSNSVVTERAYETNHNLTGLLSGSNYLVAVTAFNYLGAMSEPSASVVIQTNPISPTLSPVDVTNTSISISWSTETGVFLTLIRVRRSDGNSVFPLPVIQENGEFYERHGTTALISGLSMGTEYNFVITSFGISKKSDPATLTHITIPSYPMNVRVLQQSDSSIDFAWDNSTGSSEYFTTIVSRDLTFADQKTTTLAEVSYTGLSVATSFTATFIASNYAGNSSEAVLSSGTEPGPPIGLSSNVSNNSIQIMFTVGLGATSSIISGTGQNGNTLSANTTGTTVTFTNITLGIAYNFSVVSVSADGLNSVPAYLLNVTAPLKTFVYQVALGSSFVYQEAYQNLTSNASIALIMQLLPQFNVAFGGTVGFNDVTITNIYRGSVIIQFIVTADNPTTTAANLTESFTAQSNSSIFASQPITNLNRCLSNPCNANSTCVSTSTSFDCICNAGFMMSGTACLDANECSSNPCGDNSTCTNNVGSFACACDVGFSGNGTNCTNIDECSSSPCHANASCVDNSGSYSCSCITGYSGNGFMCVDDDECVTTPCHTNAKCNNTEGSYTCSCNEGYTGNGMTVCIDVNECSSEPCDTNADCANNNGSYACTCRPGYSGNGSSCTEVDECMSSPCGSNSNCNNTAGSYTCMCSPGYSSANDRNCTDIDECATDPCNSNASCNNTMGSYICVCNNGFTGNGSACSDVDECTMGQDDCAANATCVNDVGGFNCTCDVGYEGTGSTCIDINECLNQTRNNCSVNAGCSNTNGSYICACNSGYTGDGITCDAATTSTATNSTATTSTATTSTATTSTATNSTATTSTATNSTATTSTATTSTATTSTATTSTATTSTATTSTATNSTATTSTGTTSTTTPSVSATNTTATASTAPMSTTQSTTTASASTTTLVPTTASTETTVTATTASTASTTSQVTEFTIQLTLTSEYDFTSELLDNSSAAYTVLASLVIQQLQTKIVTNLDVQYAVEGFYQGSVIVIVRVIIQGSASPNQILQSYDPNLGMALFTGSPTTDVDSCLVISCGANAVCTNIPMGTFNCSCVSGFANMNGLCTDVDECSSNSCPNAQCTNTVGSYVCGSCNQGTQNISGSCVGQCTFGFCANGATCKETLTVGNPTCECQTGFTGERCSETDVNRTLAIAFGVVAGVILIALIALGVVLYKRRHTAAMHVAKDF